MKGVVIETPKFAWKTPVNKHTLKWAFQPVAVLSSAGGMLPLTFINRRFTRMRHLPAVVTTVVLAIYYIFCFFVIKPPMWKHLEDGESTFVCSYAILFAAELFLPLVAFAAIQRKSNGIDKLLEHVVSIESDLNPQEMNRKLRQHSYFLVLWGLFITGVTLFSWIWPYFEETAEDPEVGDLILYLLLTHSAFLLNIPVMQAMFLALAIKRCFKEVNTIIHYTYGNLKTRPGWRISEDMHVHRKGLDVACRNFMDLYDLTDDVGKVYGRLLTIRYAAFLLDTISMLYYMVYVASAKLRVLDMVTNSVYMLCNVATVIMLTSLLGEVSVQATESVSDLIRLYTYSASRNHQNYAKPMLMMMLGPPIEITASHFFSVKYGLVTSILGTITTYFIILAQFKGAEDDDETTTPTSQRN